MPFKVIHSTYPTTKRPSDQATNSGAGWTGVPPQPNHEIARINFSLTRKPMELMIRAADLETDQWQGSSVG